MIIACIRSGGSHPTYESVIINNVINGTKIAFVQRELEGLDSIETVDLALNLFFLLIPSWSTLLGTS